MTAAGTMSLNDAIANLNNAPDPVQYRSGRPDSRRPAAGIDSLVAINPAIATQYNAPSKARFDIELKQGV
ncbi:MAG: hypothetical protein ACRD7E_02605 [Bryobacteraceae bacterium]